MRSTQQASAQGRAAAEAASLLGVSRYGDAIVAIARGLSAAPEDVELLGLLAQANLGLGDLRTALASAERVIAVAPSNDWGHRLRAVALAGLRRHPEAEAAAREAVRVSPNSASVYLVLCDRLLERYKLREARKAAVRLLELAPEWADAYDAVGRVQLKRGRFREAQQQFRRAISIEPNNARFHNNLGVALRGRGYHLKSIETLREALRLDPSSQRARENLKVEARKVVGPGALVVILILIAGAYLGFRDYQLPLIVRASLAGMAAGLVVPLVMGAALRWWRFKRLHPTVQRFYKSELKRSLSTLLWRAAFRLVWRRVSAPPVGRAGRQGRSAEHHDEDRRLLTERK